MCVCVCAYVSPGCVGSAGASPPVTYVLSLVYRRHSLTFSTEHPPLYMTYTGNFAALFYIAYDL